MSTEHATARSHLFPGETADYRRARNDLLAAEIELRRQEEAVAGQRRALPPGGQVPEDYAFTEWDAAASGPRDVRLSELFAPGQDTLLLYSFMFYPDSAGRPLRVACPLCTSMLDGLDGELRHITRRVSFAAAAKAPIEVFAAHAHTRGWRAARLVSTAGTSYNRDYHAEDADGGQRPMATVFARDGETVRHFWSSEMYLAPMDPGQGPRHIDFMWPLWAVFDRTPEGRGADSYPRLRYPG